MGSIERGEGGPGATEAFGWTVPEVLRSTGSRDTDSRFFARSNFGVGAGGELPSSGTMVVDVVVVDVVDVDVVVVVVVGGSQLGE